MTEQHKEFIQKLIGIVTEDELFTEQEARHLIRCVRSSSPGALPDDISKVITWARKVREQMHILDTILMLAERDAIAVRPSADGDDIEMQLTLEPDQIEMHP